MITVVDYGLGNLGSVVNMLRKAGARVSITSSPTQVREAEALVIPGVGSFDTGMANLEQSGLRAALDQRVLEDRVPVLGICLGFQMMARRSEEGQRSGLGWLAADVRRFPPTATLPLPHMGWNDVEVGDPLFDGEPSPRFYFVHSYHVAFDEISQVSAWAVYGIRFCAAAHVDNIVATQFHPEKSHRFGLSLMRNFLHLVYAA